MVSTSRGRAIPAKPVFATKSEQVVWESLRGNLRDGDVLLHGIRFTDPHEGDIEVDLLLLSPTQGAAVIEVKGGSVEYRDGQWTTTSTSQRVRRINPVAQARRARHAIRRYLDRQPTWSRDLVRSQWFIALPHTRVLGDMGPEGRREQIIDSTQIDTARSHIDDAIPPLPSPLYGTATWVGEAVDLLLSAPDASLSDTRWSEAIPPSRSHRRTWFAVSSAAAALAVLGLVVFGWPGAPSEQATSSTPEGSALSSPQTRTQALGRGCDPAYSPCVLIAEDRNCPDIGFRVFLTGTNDPYGLDRDGDREGCETYPISQTGEAP